MSTEDASRRRAEARLGALIAASTDLVYVMSADGREMRVLDDHGLIGDADIPPGDWLQRLVPEREHARVGAAIDAAVAGKTVFDLEFRAFGPDGREGWIRSRAVPVLDADGEIVEWLGLVRDISRSRRAEAALLASEQRFRAVFEQSTGGIAQVDLEGRLVLFNDRFCEIVGRPREELATMRMQELTHPGDLERNLALLRQHLAEAHR